MWKQRPADSSVPGTAPFLDRRGFLRAAAVVTGSGLVLPAVAAAPGWSRSSAPGRVRSDRPALPNGVQSGDVTATQAVVWGRTDRVARLVVRVCPTEAPARGTRWRTHYGTVATPGTDFTAKALVRHLRPDTAYEYRVQFVDLDDPSVRGEVGTGHFRTAPLAGRRDVRFLWSGDMVGQGWGINPDLSGIPLFAAMLKTAPDFFIHSGDTIYADGPLKDRVVLPDGRVWRNVVTPAKANVAQTLDEFRGAFRYNFLDRNVRAFVAGVPQINQWDDHETHNNWFPGEILDDARYTERRADVLSARARRAFFEYVPMRPQGAGPDGRIYRKRSYGPLLDVFVLDMRSYRDRNDGDPRSTVPDGGILGTRQTRWLLRELRRSTATWKVIAADQPLGIQVPDRPPHFEAVSNLLDGPPGARELEIAWLLHQLQRHRVHNLVWLTADVHYTSANYYDPSKAAFQDFDPFWEFVSGPLNAGAFPASPLDDTFGPRAVFTKAPPAPNSSPLDDYQFFGQVDIDGASEALTVTLKDKNGASLWDVTLERK